MGHSARVRRLAVALARRLAVGEALLQEIAMGAELHDIGKIGVPDALLHKAGSLTPDERRRILEHTVIGEQILAPLLRDQPVILAVVRWHHERVDGSGYPDALRGEQIPLAARIVAVADAFDAMTSERPYRPARSRPEAVRELLRCSGSHFDPVCVRALLEVFRELAENRPRAAPDQRFEMGAASRWPGSRPRRWRGSGGERGPPPLESRIHEREGPPTPGSPAAGGAMLERPSDRPGSGQPARRSRRNCCRRC
ncbi:MAG: HD-GYP domain-containing protein [Gemmatimonadetes bacterium]|nr:HD-GYP domain-containing protein [Gemmatimonadota bacterium]